MPFRPATGRRQDLLEIALALFVEKGYEATSVADIVSRAGLSKGAFYHHFESREALLEALAEHFVRRSMLGIEAVLDNASLNAFEKLETCLARHRDWEPQFGPRMVAAFIAIFRPDNLLLYHRIHLAAMRIVSPILARIIAEGVADRVFDTPDAESAAEMVLLLGASTHDITGRVLAATSRAERDAALAALERRVGLIGIAADRLLGLPDGSIRFVDGDFLTVFDAALPPLSGPRLGPGRRRSA
jgi:AcrR family transcriptional regulator